MGAVIQSGTSTTKSLPVSTLANGIYYLKLISKAEHTIGALVKWRRRIYPPLFVYYSASVVTFDQR
jgi:hypothetical protein